MKTKICFKCKKEKPISDYYKHSGMTDGHVGKCKECNKKDVQDNYIKNIDYFREYNRKRHKLPHAKKYNADMQRLKKKEHNAHNRVYNKYTRIDKFKKPKNCSICNKTKCRIVGHHDDYNKPLDIIWLCDSCHQKLHVKLREVA